MARPENPCVHTHTPRSFCALLELTLLLFTNDLTIEIVEHLPQ
jgi:hypothetical protein